MQRVRAIKNKVRCKNIIINSLRFIIRCANNVVAFHIKLVHYNETIN